MLSSPKLSEYLGVPTGTLANGRYQGLGLAGSFVELLPIGGLRFGERLRYVVTAATCDDHE